MGHRQSIYERSGLGNYLKLSPDERALIKSVWIYIENNPQFHGNAIFTSFCKTFPQYVKYFSSDHHHLYLSFDPRTIAKFTVIIEALGFIFLDFSNKPKQLDRLLGYIAMVHKDMRLDRADFAAFHGNLIKYLETTFPTVMNEQSHDAFNKYMKNVMDQICRKINDFRIYDTMSPNETTYSSILPCGKYFPFGETLIFGQTLLYWKERKREWEDRLKEWMLKSTEVQESGISGISSTDEDDLHRTRTEDEFPGTLRARRKSSIYPRRIAQERPMIPGWLATENNDEDQSEISVDDDKHLTTGKLTKSYSLQVYDRPEEFEEKRLVPVSHLKGRDPFERRASPRERHRAQKDVFPRDAADDDSVTSPRLQGTSGMNTGSVRETGRNISARERRRESLRMNE